MQPFCFSEMSILVRMVTVVRLQWRMRRRFNVAISQLHQRRSRWRWMHWAGARKRYLQQWGTRAYTTSPQDVFIISACQIRAHSRQIAVQHREISINLVNVRCRFDVTKPHHRWRILHIILLYRSASNNLLMSALQNYETLMQQYFSQLRKKYEWLAAQGRLWIEWKRKEDFADMYFWFNIFLYSSWECRFPFLSIQFRNTAIATL